MNPWEKYQAQQPADTSPWLKYQAASELESAKPAPDRSFGDYAQLAARTVAGGVTDLADLAMMASPTGIARNVGRQITGEPADPTAGELATQGFDKLDFAKPETSGEKYADTIGRALVGTKGLGMAAKGTVLAENMGRQLLSAATGAGASEAANQGGLGAGAQLAAGVAGALTPGSVAAVAKNTLGGGAADVIYALSEGGKRSKPLIDEGLRLAEQHGVDLTPAQISTGGAANAIENAARQSIFSRDAAFASDMKRADQYVSAINKTMEKISKGTSLATGETLRNNITRAVDDLSTARRNAAAVDFGAVDKLANGAPVIKPNRLRETIDGLIDENSVAPEGSGQAAIADALKKMRSRFVVTTETPTGTTETLADMRAGDMLKTRRYLSQLAGGQSSLAGSTELPVQKRAAAQLLSALDDDIEAVGAQGGELGDAIKNANAKYREYSQRIDGVKKGPLRTLIGEDLTDASGNGFASIPEEKIMAGFSKLEPSQIKTVRGLIQKQDPEGWQAIKRAHIQSALEKAMETTGTEGAQQLPIRPARFFQALGAKTVDQNRLAAMMDPDELQQIDDLFKIGKRLGDRTGFNNSGTGPYQQLMGAISGIRSAGTAMAIGAGVGGVAGALSAPAAQAMTMRRVAAVMADPDARKAAMDIARLPSSSPTALRAHKYLAGVMGAENPAAMAAVAGGAVSNENPDGGMIEAGNIDLAKRPVVRNADGTISTVRSISANFDGKEVLIPTVSEDGRIMSDDDAIDQYRRTGRNLGKFRDPASADRYAEQLHEQQAKFYGNQSGGESRDKPIAVRTPQEAKAYPSGTWVLLPDGTTEQVP